VIEGVATLQEVETWYTIDDVEDMIECLEAYQAAKAESEQAR
jgi:hypothetical protein